jgi:hypothetical protein
LLNTIGIGLYKVSTKKHFEKINLKSVNIKISKKKTKKNEKVDKKILFFDCHLFDQKKNSIINRKKYHEPFSTKKSFSF